MKTLEETEFCYKSVIEETFKSDRPAISRENITIPFSINVTCLCLTQIVENLYSLNTYKVESI